MNFIDIDFTEYLKPTHDDTLRPYLSSTELCRLLERSIAPKDTAALGFGRTAHEILEHLFNPIAGFIFIANSQAKTLGLKDPKDALSWDHLDALAGKDPKKHKVLDDLYLTQPKQANTDAKAPLLVVQDAPENLLKLKQILICAIPLIKEFTAEAEAEDHYTEGSLYIQASTICDNPTPFDYLSPLHNALKDLGRGIKIRFDYLQEYSPGEFMLCDWKTTTDVTLDKIEKDIHFYRYRLKMAFYLLALNLAGHRAELYKLVMFPKLKTPGRVVVYNWSGRNPEDQESLHDYLELMFERYSLTDLADERRVSLDTQKIISQSLF